jgi:hypothetical protein
LANSKHLQRILRTLVITLAHLTIEHWVGGLLVTSHIGHQKLAPGVFFHIHAIIGIWEIDEKYTNY